ncbi:MAG: hypothetical protein JNK72_21755 [Myxococcales bacterium]|nr:hypothetical protein [Myxococcales bacterium]
MNRRPLSPVVALALMLSGKAFAQSTDLPRQQFASGRALYDAHSFPASLEAFRASQSALPSPNTLLYIARCLRELGRSAEAWEAFQEAARDAQARSGAEPRYARTAEAAQTEGAALTGRVAFVVLDGQGAPPNTATALNGRQVDPARFGALVAVEPGTFTVTASAPGFQPFVASQSVVPGQQARVSVSLSPLGAGPAIAPMVTVLPADAPSALPTRQGPVVMQRASSPWRVVGAVSMGLGAALGIVGAVTGLRARGIEEDLVRACPDGCAPTYANRRLVDEGNTLVTVTNVSWGVGGAALVLGAIAFFTSGPGAVEVYTPSLARRELRPYYDPQRGVAGLGGTF